MHMPGLARLHASMRQVGIDRATFRITHNHLVFSGVFLVDSTPWQFGLACIGHNFTLRFDVSKRYEIATYIHDPKALGSLITALGTGAASGHRFSPNEFLHEIDAALPATVTKNDRPRPADMALHRRDVEEADKIHFCGWGPHARDGTHHVRAKNLHKTRALLGEADYEWCKRNDVSTKWTDDPALAFKIIERPQWPGYS